MEVICLVPHKNDMKIIISQYCYRFKKFGLEVIMYPCPSFETRHYGV
jgi:hypothetical protein